MNEQIYDVVDKFASSDMFNEPNGYESQSTSDVKTGYSCRLSV